MNFLAHLYLSGEDVELKIGNFIGDFVKGKDLPQYSKGVQNGIFLHRAIDDFTDHHAIVQKSKDRLRPKYRHYAGVIVDIFYDHYLAIHWKKFADTSLEDYVNATYAMLQERKTDLPPNAQYMLPYMIEHNWLYNYQYFSGIERVMQGMSRRSRFNSKMDESVAELKAFHADFEEEFLAFFPDLQQHCKEFMASL